MNILKNISSETIRQNWLNYKDEIYNSPYYELLWESLESKFEIDKNDVYLTIFKTFIGGEEIDCEKLLFDGIHINQINEETLVLKGLTGEERKHIHSLCDKIGLHHVSKSENTYDRFLYIYKPKVWLWEFTEKNPYSKSEEHYGKGKLSRKYCCICEKNGLETDLYCSVYIRGLYCEDCLETTSDDDGGKLCDHKFEPL